MKGEDVVSAKVCVIACFFLCRVLLHLSLVPRFARCIVLASSGFPWHVVSTQYPPPLHCWPPAPASLACGLMFFTSVVAIQLHLPTARLRHEAQKPGETAEEGPLPTCAMSIEAAAIFIKVLGGTGKAAPAAEPLLKKNPALLQSATQLFEAAKILYPGMHHVSWCN